MDKNKTIVFDSKSQARCRFWNRTYMAVVRPFCHEPDALSTTTAAHAGNRTSDMRTVTDLCTCICLLPNKLDNVDSLCPRSRIRKQFAIACELVHYNLSMLPEFSQSKLSVIYNHTTHRAVNLYNNWYQLFVASGNRKASVNQHTGSIMACRSINQCLYIHPIFICHISKIPMK